MTHPLTDNTIRYVEKLGCHDFGTWIYTENDLRTAADWQLEQVIEWMKTNLMKHTFHDGYAYLYDDCSNAYIKEEELLKDIKKAMRPTTQEES